jgi:adenylate cyclase
MDRATFPRARDFFARSMAEDPSFAAPAAWSGWWHVRNVGQGWSADPAADRARGAEHAARAVELDGRNAVAQATLGHLKSFLLHDYDGALMYLNRALVAGLSNALAWALSSATLSYVGHSRRAVRHVEHALRLSPFDPALSLFHNILGIAHYTAGDHEKALRFLRLADDANTPFSANLRYLIGTLVALGRRDEAAAAAARLLRLEPDFRLSVFERTRLAFRRPDLRAEHMARLRAAGLPD